MDDIDVPAWWRRLGLPGLLDVHVHFLPDRVMEAVWRYFDAAEEHYGLAWPIHYRTSEPERVSTLRTLGVRAFPALVYAHKPGMAEGLGEWALSFAERVPECVPSGTFYAEAAAAGYVRRALEAGAWVFKVHVQVGDFDPRDPSLREVWGMLADAGAPVVVHCGGGPRRGRYTGPGPFGEVLAEHPTLTAVIAHCGAPEYDEHLDLVERYPNVHVDTTMVGTPYLNALAPLLPTQIARLGALCERVVLGTDFPNIPYSYATQLEALQSFELGEDWLRAVCWTNPARLLRYSG